MQVLQIATVPQFIERLRSDPPQLQLLFREFLIGVTQFFRDLPLRSRRCTAGHRPPVRTAPGENADPIRVWVPGCATGEEVYSIAIVLREELEQRGMAREVQIFGTDIDDAAIAAARAARFPRAMHGLSAERIERWFVKQGEDQPPRSSRSARMCIFSGHNVSRSTVLEVDLISGRNLMI